jgi:hypothetical protein
VTLAHRGGLETTYSRLEAVYVTAGQSVRQGHWIGTSGYAHPGAVEELHFGVKLDGSYVDPERWLGPADVGRAIHLAPLEEGARCSEASAGYDPPPPNDNVAIAIAGLGSLTTDPAGPDAYRAWLERLGYRRADSYVFSYGGPTGPELHRPYGRTETYGGLLRAASRLRALLVRIGGARPGTDVDLVAHSQGGVVARVLLEVAAQSWDRRLPRVEHVVTLASPHAGSPLARLPRALAASPPAAFALRALRWLASRGWLPLPAGGAEALDDLTPGSPLLTALARQDVTFGTRVLSLAMPHDLVVPSARSRVAHETFRVVAPEGLWGHRSILESERARSLAYSFLRDAPDPCVTAWDSAGGLLAALGGLGRVVAGWALRTVAAGLLRANS